MFTAIYAIMFAGMTAGNNAHFMQGERPLATIAPVATQQAVVCVNNILNSIEGYFYTIEKQNSIANKLFFTLFND